MSKFVAWQIEPSAFCNMSNKKPSSQSRQVSSTHEDAACCNAKFLRIGVKCITCNRAFAYELAMWISRPE